MAYDPNEPRDNHGRWGALGSSPSASKAIDWLKSGEAKSVIAKISAPENIKSAAVLAVQGALFKLTGINEPNIDVAIKSSVNSLANDMRVTKAHARQVMMVVVNSLLKARG